MVERFHVIGRHRRASTVSVLNREGVEAKLVSLTYDFNGYVETLGLRRCCCHGNRSGIVFLGRQD